MKDNRGRGGNASSRSSNKLSGGSSQTEGKASVAEKTDNCKCDQSTNSSRVMQTDIADPGIDDYSKAHTTTDRG